MENRAGHHCDSLLHRPLCHLVHRPSTRAILLRRLHRCHFKRVLCCCDFTFHLRHMSVWPVQRTSDDVQVSNRYPLAYSQPSSVQGSNGLQSHSSSKVSSHTDYDRIKQHLHLRCKHADCIQVVVNQRKMWPAYQRSIQCHHTALVPHASSVDS